MKVDEIAVATRSVADLPATDARELMRRFDDAAPESVIGSWIHTGSRTGAEIASAFEDGAAPRGVSLARVAQWRRGAECSRSSSQAR